MAEIHDRFDYFDPNLRNPESLRGTPYKHFARFEITKHVKVGEKINENEKETIHEFPKIGQNILNIELEERKK